MSADKQTFMSQIERGFPFTGEKSMDRNEAITLLQKCKPERVRRFGLVRLELFGSTARNSASKESDVDILVGFDGTAHSRQFFGVQFYLEDLIGEAATHIPNHVRTACSHIPWRMINHLHDHLPAQGSCQY